MSLQRAVKRFLLFSLLACLAVSGVAKAAEYHGQVTFGGLAVPGSTVTVTATQGDKKAVAITDDQGIFSFADLADGNWTLTIEMTGFAPVKQVVAVGQGAAAGTFELKLLSIDEIRAAVKPVKVDATQLASAATPAGPAAGSAAAPATGKAAAGGKGAAPAAKGAAAKTAAGGAAPAPDAPAPQQDATAQQANDGFLINGSVNNAATSQFSMNQAFGNNRSGGRSLYNGGFLLRLDNSALDALPWSPTGAPESQQFNNFTAGIQGGGPLNIPRLMPRGPYVGIGYQRQQNSTFNTNPIKIPTGEDAAGDWNLTSPTVTSIYVPANLATLFPACSSYLAANGSAVTQTSSGPIFANNTIPAACVSHQATVLEALYPQTTNLNGNPLGYNYQLPLDQSSHSDGLQISVQKQLGNKNNLNGRFNLQSTRTANPSIFGFHDSSAALGMNANANWNHRFTQRFSGNLGYAFGRNRNQTIPNFAGKNNIEATAGIASPNTNPTYWGPPTLGFASGIATLSDGVSQYNRNESNKLSVSFYWNHFRHNVQFGGDFLRSEFNYLTESNPYGSMSFTGAATRPSPTATSGGSDFADFLLGIPDTSAIAYGNADKYLRQSVYDLFLVDDFRVNPELSINAGLRWEFGAPVTELKGRLVNLDIAPGFTGEAPVLGSNPTGSLTGNSYPSSLVHPDYSRPEPRIGIAWRPISGSSLLVRAKYDVTNDTSVYQSSAYQMAQQHGTAATPLSTSLTVANSTSCAFNIANPFAQLPCSTTTPDQFAIDPNFKVGYVQTWGTSLQRDLPGSLQMVALYEGIKGTRGVQEFLPNTCAPGVTVGCSFGPSGYYYRTSGGNLTREMGSMELRRRLRNGLQARMLYTFAKSIDDDYSLSAQGGVMSNSGVAQDWQHLNTQRALSTTDQRHNVQFTAQYTTGMGIGGHSMMTGWRGLVYKEWTIQTSITAGTGFPETPICGSCTTSGTGITGPIRPNVTGSPYSNLSPGYYLSSAAYAAPSGSWGNAGRDSIEGPDQFTMNAGMNRTFRLHDHYNLDAQLNATNVLNHVVVSGYNTTFSQYTNTFGAPVGAGGMRAISVQFRLRFQ